MYGLVVGLPTQRKQIEKHCFGDCGKIIIGGCYDDKIGEIGLCRQDECPYLDKQMDKAFGESHGEKLFLRKLKEDL